MRCITLISIALSVIAISLFPAYAEDPIVASRPGNGHLDWHSVLNRYGEKFSLYFTVEGDDTDESKPSSLRNPFVADPVDVKDAEAFLDLIRKWHPTADVVRDETYKDVVHIRDKSLGKLESYPLHAKISLIFNGQAGNLFSTIEKDSNSTVMLDHELVSMQQPYDMGRITQVDAKDITYAALLTAALPHWSNHELWRCFTVAKKGRLVSEFLPGKSSQAATSPSTYPK